MKKRIPLERIIVIAGILVVLFLTLITRSYYQNVLRQVAKDGGEDGGEYRGRRQKLAKGYYVEPFTGVLIKMVIISVVLLAFMFRLAQYKGIPNALIWVAVIIGIYSYIASKTTTGRCFYAVGGNEKAAKLSGINTNRVYFLAYLNMGLLAAVIFDVVNKRKFFIAK